MLPFLFACSGSEVEHAISAPGSRARFVYMFVPEHSHHINPWYFFAVYVFLHCSSSHGLYPFLRFVPSMVPPICQPGQSSSAGRASSKGRAGGRSDRSTEWGEGDPWWSRMACLYGILALLPRLPPLQSEILQYHGLSSDLQMHWWTLN